MNIVPTRGQIDNIEHQLSKLRDDILKIHVRINDIQHNKTKNIVTEINEQNVIGRVEALDDIEKRVRELESKYIYDKVVEDRLIAHDKALKEFKEWKEWTAYTKLDNLQRASERDDNRINKLEEWKSTIITKNNEWFDRVYKDKKMMDKKVWDKIKLRVQLIAKYGCPRTVDGGLNYNIRELVDFIKKVDQELCPND